MKREIEARGEGDGQRIPGPRFRDAGDADGSADEREQRPKSVLLRGTWDGGECERAEQRGGEQNFEGARGHAGGGCHQEIARSSDKGERLAAFRVRRYQVR